METLLAVGVAVLASSTIRTRGFGFSLLSGRCAQVSWVLLQQGHKQPHSCHSRDPSPWQGEPHVGWDDPTSRRAPR